MTARAQHNLAAVKLPLLNSSRSSYLTALSLLPEPQRFSPKFEEAEGYSDSGSAYSVPSESSALPRTPNLENPALVSGAASSPLDGHGKFPTDFHDRPYAFPDDLNSATCLDRPLPLFHVPSPRVTFAVPEPAPLRSEAEQRYNAHLADFWEMLDRHHSEVIAMIVAVMDAQASRYSVLRAMYEEKRASDDDDLKAAQKRERIKALKESGWKRERFNPSRCEALCERALAEL